MALYNVKITEFENEVRITTYDKPIITNKSKKKKEHFESKIPEADKDIYDIALQQFKFYMSVDLTNGKSFDSVTDDDVYGIYYELYLDYVQENKNDLIRILETIKRNKPKVLTEVQKAEKSTKDSLSRAIQNCCNIGKANNWEWFLTLTFNKHKVDRLDYNETSNKMSQWLKNVKKVNEDMIYLAVPELHEKGGFHYHILMSNVPNLKMSESGKLSYGKYIIDANKDLPKWVKDKTKLKTIFHVNTYSYGWSTATKIQDNEKSIGYITKYLNKSLNETVPKGKKKYWASKNVNKPKEEKIYIPIEQTKTINGNTDYVELINTYPFKEYVEALEKSNPKFQKKIEVRTEYINDINIYEFKKNLE